MGALPFRQAHHSPTSKRFDVRYYAVELACERWMIDRPSAPQYFYALGASGASYRLFV